MVVIEELCARSMSVGGGYIQSVCYAGLNLAEIGSEAQKRSCCPGGGKEGLMFAYGFTEPDIGADIASVRTSAVTRGRQSGD